MTDVQVQMSLVGAKRTRAVLLTKEEHVKRGTRRGLKDWAEAAADIMRSIVPVRTRRLLNAIKVEGIELLSWGYSTFVGPGDRVRYAPFVEYGTKDTPEQPYARPTSQLAAKVGGAYITKAVRRSL